MKQSLITAVPVLLMIVTSTNATEKQARKWIMNAAHVAAYALPCKIDVGRQFEGSIHRAMQETDRDQADIKALVEIEYEQNIRVMPKMSSDDLDVVCSLLRRAVNTTNYWSIGASAVAGETVLPYDKRYYDPDAVNGVLYLQGY